jgi:hypothetical protein
VQVTLIRTKLILTLVLAMLVVTMGHAADMDENDPLSESESGNARHRIEISLAITLLPYPRVTFIR